jgi:hypothetical protein
MSMSVEDRLIVIAGVGISMVAFGVAASWVAWVVTFDLLAGVIIANGARVPRELLDSSWLDNLLPFLGAGCLAWALTSILVWFEIPAGLSAHRTQIPAPPPPPRQD